MLIPGIFPVSPRRPRRRITPLAAAAKQVIPRIMQSYLGLGLESISNRQTIYYKGSRRFTKGGCGGRGCTRHVTCRQRIRCPCNCRGRFADNFFNPMGDPGGVIGCPWSPDNRGGRFAASAHAAKTVTAAQPGAGCAPGRRPRSLFPCKKSHRACGRRCVSATAQTHCLRAGASTPSNMFPPVASTFGSTYPPAFRAAQLSRQPAHASCQWH